MDFEDLIHARPSRRVHQATWYRDRLEAGKTHGLSTAELASRAGLTVGTIYNWKRRLKATGLTRQPGSAQEQQLVHVTFASEAAADPQTDCFELRLPGGRSVVVPPQFEQSALSALLEVLDRC